MSIISENLSALRSRYPSLHARITSECVLDYTFEVLPSKSRLPTAKVRGQFLHSSYDPQKEAIRAITQYVDTKVYAYILYGFGLGYYIEALQDRINERVDLYVVVDNVNHFFSALHFRSFRKIFIREHTHYLLRVSGDVLVELVQYLDIDSFKIVHIRSLSAPSREYFASLNDEMRALMLRKQGNRNTTTKFSLIWVTNYLRNIPHILRARDCFNAYKIANGMPVLLIAAGPSVDAYLARIKQYAHKICIVAVDTVCNALLAADIIPDFIIAIDPQYWNSRHIDKSDYRHSTLVYDPCVHPRVLRARYRHTITFSTAVPIATLLRTYIPIRPSLGAGGTVTSIGWEFARWIGASAIYLLGVDFGYPNNKIHCDNCFFERDMLAKGRWIDGTESRYYHYLQSSPLEMTYAYDTQPLRSDHRLAIYAEWFRGHIAHHPTPSTITLSTRSRRIEGISQMNIAELKAFPDVRARKKELLRSLTRQKPIEHDVDANAADAILRAVESITATITEIYARMPMDDTTHEYADTIIARTSLPPSAKMVVRGIVQHYMRRIPSSVASQIVRQQIDYTIKKLSRISSLTHSPTHPIP